MGFLDKILKFLAEVKAEAKRVNWPTKRETLNYTLIVIGTSIFVALILGGLDFIFTYLRNKFIF
jgi:preprotein translocase subunit SecE